MKTFETEKHNIPEGATHYFNENENEKFAWWNEDEALLLCPGNSGQWEPARGIDDVSSPIPIPQAKEVEWVNGLPPVGVECLYAFASGDYSEWFECEILYVGKQCVFIKTKDENLIKSFGCEELSVEICNIKFRKKETEAERVEREREDAINEMSLIVESGNGFAGNAYKKYCASLYDAGYRKESE